MALVDAPAISKPDREQPSRITTPTLLRLAGLSALLAGICYVFVGVFHPSNVASSVTTTRWEVVHLIACAMCLFAQSVFRNDHGLHFCGGLHLAAAGDDRSEVCGGLDGHAGRPCKPRLSR